MKTFRNAKPTETSGNLIRRSSERNRLQHETRQQTLPYVIRYPRRQSSQRSEFSNNQSTSRYFDNNLNPQRYAYDRSSHHDYSYHNFSPSLNRNHFTRFRQSSIADDRSERANTSLNRNVMPPSNRRQNRDVKHDDRHCRYPSSTRSRSQNSYSSEHGNVGNVNRIAPSSTRSESVNWLEPSPTHSETGIWISPSSFRSEDGNWVSSSTQFGNWTFPVSSQLENINLTYSTQLESSQTSASQASSEQLHQNENHESQQNEDTVHWIGDRNPTIEIAEPHTRKLKKIVKPNRETMSSTISCPVCLCNYDEIIDSGKHLVSGKCGHIICNMCINILLDQRKHCPRCRCSLYRSDIWRLYI